MARDILLVVEDELSGVVLQKLVEECGGGLNVERVFQMRGYGKIQTGIQRFKNASNAIPHIVLTDLDARDCAPSMLNDWGVVANTNNMLFRVAVREVEAWLLADREGIAEYLNLPLAKIPLFPEQEADPKQSLLSLVRKCKKRRLVMELVPPPGSSISIGPLYNIRLSECVRTIWNLERAAVNSDSLSRAINRISSF